MQSASNNDTYNSVNELEECLKSICLCGGCLELLGQLLFQHEDFSLYDSLVRLELSAPINPHSEQTLKGNTENGYCRSFYAEFFPLIYLPEFKAYKGWIKNKLNANDRSPWLLEDKFKEKQEQIRDNFYKMPLKKVASPKKGFKQLHSILQNCCLIFRYPVFIEKPLAQKIAK